MTSGHARKKKACKVHKMHYRSTVNLYICRISLTLLSIFSKLQHFPSSTTTLCFMSTFHTTKDTKVCTTTALKEVDNRASFRYFFY